MWGRGSLTLAAAATGLVAAPAWASFIDNSDPAHRRAAASNGSSTLTPAPALYREAGDCSWVIQGLAAQGYSTDPALPPDRRWTINLRHLEGTLTLDVYNAWVNRAPALTCDGQEVFTERAAQGLGGAVFCLTYQPMGADPSGANVHWVQGIRDNMPNQFEMDHGVDDGGGYRVSIDNPDTFGVNPFFDAPGDGVHSATFVADRPRRPLVDGVNWQAQMFITTADLDQRTINLYDGVWWGFTLTAPEPGTLALLGAWGVLAGRRRR